MGLSEHALHWFKEAEKAAKRFGPDAFYHNYTRYIEHFRAHVRDPDLGDCRFCRLWGPYAKSWARDAVEVELRWARIVKLRPTPRSESSSSDIQTPRGGDGVQKGKP